MLLVYSRGPVTRLQKTSEWSSLVLLKLFLVRSPLCGVHHFVAPN